MFTQSVKSVHYEKTENDEFDYSSALVEAGISDTVKMVTVPMAKGKFMLRLHNIADLFDKDADTKKVNKTSVIEAMWKAGNANNKDASMGSFSV